MVLVAGVTGACMLLSVLMMGATPGMAIADTGEARGAFLNKNVLGWAAVLGALTGGLVAVDRGLGLRRTGIAVFALSLVCLLASQSMTGLLSALMALTLVWFYARLTRSRGLSRVAFVLVFLQAAAAVLVGLEEFLVPLLEALGKDATLTGRVPLWLLVDQVIGDRLLLGYGYQTFWTDASADAWRIWAEIGWMAPHSHNGFRETLLSLGLVGMLPLLAVIVRAARQGAALQCRAPEDGWLWLNVWIGTFLVMNLTESIILAQNDVFWTLFMTAAIAFALRYPEQRAESSVRTPN
jgi:O-antigen ligase